MKFNNLYVAATSQHVGKTTCTLGLVSAFIQRGIKVGYCKPVGQQFLDINDDRVDKDALLFSDTINFELRPDVHSPVILGHGAVSAYLDDPVHYHFEDRIRFASGILQDINEFVIFEGTGHPGVGSVVNLSNADVAKLVNAGVIMVVEGGIGKTIDMLSMCTSLFREKQVPLLGVIVNKVMPDKMEKVRHYVGDWLRQKNIPLLGMLPYDQSLGYPMLRTIVETIDGQVIYNGEDLERKVVGIVGSSIIDDPRLTATNDLLLIISMRRVDEAIKSIKKISKTLQLPTSPITGIIATADGTITQKTLDYINKYRIPFIRSRLDTYGAVIKINRIEVKINSDTPWKVERAIDMINKYVDLDLIEALCKPK